MSKISLGDYVYVERRHKNGTVIGKIGGNVGRYTVKLDDGDVLHSSARDLIVIKSNKPKPIYSSDISIEHKFSLLLDYLGLELEDDPKIVKRLAENEEASD